MINKVIHLIAGNGNILQIFLSEKYPNLSKCHNALIPRLIAVLKQMEKDHEKRRIYNSVIKECMAACRAKQL